TATFDIKRVTENLNSVVHDLVASPLVSRLVQPFLSAGQDPAQRFAVLLDSRINQINFDMPGAGVIVHVDSTSLSQWLSSSFGLPATLFQSASGQASQLSFGAFTPGYGGPGSTGVERYGGFRLDAQLNVSGLVQNAHFFFEVELFNFDDPASFAFPNFVARASVANFTIPGLDTTGMPANLLTFSNAFAEI